MSKLIIRGQEVPRTWLASGSEGVRLQRGSFPYDLFLPWVIWNGILFGEEVVPTTKSLSIDPIEGNEPLRKNGETPKRLLPNSMLLDFFSMHTKNAWAHSNLGLEFHDRQGDFGPIHRPWVLSIVTDQPTWQGKHDELARICDLVQFPHVAFAYKPIIELVVGCPNADIPLENIFSDAVKSIDLLRRRLPDWPLCANVSPVAEHDLFRAMQEGGADCLRICNTIPDSDEYLPQGRPWRHNRRFAKRCRGKYGSYSGPMCVEVVLDTLSAIRDLISIPIGVGNGFYTTKLIKLAYDEYDADFISIGMIKLYRPWRLPGLVRVANTYK